MAEKVFTYCLALHVFRAGVGRKIACALNVGICKFPPIFFGQNMPIYMEIYTRESFIRFQYPEKNESDSVSGRESKWEEGDFTLE